MTTAMKIYHLARTTDMDRHYDTLDAIVIAARNEAEARRYTSYQAKDEKAQTWLDPETATCTQVGNALRGLYPEAGVVICADTTGF